MAIDTPARHIYSGDGSTRVFPIPTYIQGDDYIRIEINGVHQVDRSKWDIVNNSIIFVTAPITTATIDVQVATSVEALSELGNVTNVDIVAGSITGINGIASNLDEILLANDSAIVATTKASEASASALVATTKSSEASASATSASASATLATTKANEASTSASTATTKASEALSSASIASTKASEAAASATSASSSATTASSGATTATTKASEASTSAINALASENKAKKWADESEDVPVESGLYSAKHWASQAAKIVGDGLIDDVTPSTSTIFSSTRSNNTYEPKNNNIQGHISNNTANPHNVTKSQVGLSNVDNTSDANKPISTATQSALDLKADDNTVVKLTKNQTVAGVKTFTSSPVVPTPTTNFQAATKQYVDINSFNPTPIIATGTATFNSTTNNINLTGIGVGVEIGDVIQISGAEDAKNNSEFTIEVITDANNVIVNQAHANKGTTKNVAARSGDTGVTVKLLAKWYNASDGLGQDWVNVTANRVRNTLYPNNTNRKIEITATLKPPNTGSAVFIEINSNGIPQSYMGSLATHMSMFTTAGKGANYKFTGTDINITIIEIWERR